MDGCVFCRVAEGKAPAQVLFADDEVVAFHDLHPQAPVHVLVIPRRHVASLAAAEPADAELLGRLQLACAEAARRTGIDASGYRVVANSGAGAGQSVFHLHYHVLGRRTLHLAAGVMTAPPTATPPPDLAAAVRGGLWAEVRVLAEARPAPLPPAVALVAARASIRLGEPDRASDRAAGGDPSGRRARRRTPPGGGASGRRARARPAALARAPPAAVGTLAAAAPGGRAAPRGLGDAAPRGARGAPAGVRSPAASGGS